MEKMVEKGVGGGRGTVRGFTFALKNSVGLGGGGGGWGSLLLIAMQMQMLC